MAFFDLYLCFIAIVLALCAVGSFAASRTYWFACQDAVPMVEEVGVLVQRMWAFVGENRM